MKRTFFIIVTSLSFAILFIGLGDPLSVIAYTMSSSHYQIDADSVNSGGDSFSTSTNYSLGDTVGEAGTGFASSTSYILSAGYWTPADTYISISNPVDVNAGSINGLVGGVSTSSSSWVVTTNNSLGYQLTISSNTNPSLKGVHASIPDYVPAGADPDYTFTSTSTQAQFGFSPEGSDVAARFKDNGSICNFGTNDTSDACWDGISTTPKIIAEGATANEPSGATTTVKYMIQIGSGVIQDSDTYHASVTVTATTL